MSSEAQKLANKNKIDMVVKEIIRKAAPYKRLFGGEDGKAILRDLKSEFKNASVVAATPHDTVVRAAQYDVLDYIEKMINFKGEQDEIHESEV